MKIWIDLSNSPHVLFFRRLIKQLEPDHELLITARKYGYLEDIIKQEGIDAKIIGEHAGKDHSEKLQASINRTNELLPIVKQFNPDKFLCKYSIEGMRIAYGLGIPSTLVIDNDQSTEQNNLTTPFSEKTVVPECIEAKMKLAFGNVDIIGFNGTCEVANIAGFTAKKDVLDQLGLEEGKILTIRTGPLDATYFNKDTSLEKHISELSKDYDIIAFPRNQHDKAVFEKCGAKVSENGIDFHSLVYYSEAFLGEGGTMTRESALLGTPTVSCYPQQLLEVDNLLIGKNLMQHSLNPAEIARMISESNKDHSRKIAENAMGEFEDPLVKVREALEL
jgi:hypothetical protein|tara:strand:+ start:441 stop:1442 length:1002 start_codon:yes stop_codon:yes gene_type:complete